jgi:hypothetical protein
MTHFNATSKETARRARATAIEVNQGVEQQTFRTRKVMVLLAIVMLGTAMATHAFAAGRMGGGLGLGGGFHGGHMSHGFQPPVLDEAPAMPAPTFNPSESYTLPQWSETPVSPASPGSVFGN